MIPLPEWLAPVERIGGNGGILDAVQGKNKGGGGDPQVRLLSMRIISNLSYRATNHYAVRSKVSPFFNRGGDTAGSQQKRLSCLLLFFFFFFAIMLLQFTTTYDPFLPGFVSAKYVPMILADRSEGKKFHGQADPHACEQTGSEVFLPPVVCVPWYLAI